MQRNYPQFDRSIYDISKIFWLEKSSGGPKDIGRYVVSEQLFFDEKSKLG